MRIRSDVPIISDFPNLGLFLAERFKAIAQQVNGLTDGFISSHHGAQSTAPTTGKHRVGDEVKNATPSEVGSVGSKYIVVGWKCVVSGDPGTWVQMRVMTGN